MKTKTIVLFTLLLAVSFYQCNNKPQMHVNRDFYLRVNASSRVNNDTLEEMNKIIYATSLSLINNSDSTVNFWMNTCSWSSNFILNSESYYIIGPIDCPKNFPKVWTLEKNEKLDFSGYIIGPDTTYKDLDLKLGFIYIQKNEEARVIEIVPSPPRDSIACKMYNKHDRVIWSNSFKLN